LRSVIPHHNATDIPERFVSNLLTMAMKNMEIGWERISSECTSDDSTQARKALKELYALDSEQHCQILGTNTKRFQNAHIWPYNNRDNLVLVELKPEDIDDPKNVLRLH
jgi:hypothetical protein